MVRTEAECIREFVDNQLEGGLPVRHQGEIISKKPLEESSLLPLFFGAKAAKIEEGSICSVLQVHAIIVVSYSMAEDTGKEEVHEHWGQNASVSRH